MRVLKVHVDQIVQNSEQSRSGVTREHMQLVMVEKRETTWTVTFIQQEVKHKLLIVKY